MSDTPVSEQDFERGKRLLVEALETLIRQYEPYVKIMEAFVLLDVRVEATRDWKPGDAALMKLGYDTFLAGLKRSESAEDIERVVEENRQFFNLTFEHRDKEDA